MVLGDEAKFHEGIGRVVSYCFLLCTSFFVWGEMVYVDFGGNRLHVGWGKGSIFSQFDKDE